MTVGAQEIVKEVLDAQIQRLFLKMDRLEDEHGHFTEMPLPHFQQHSRLGRQAACLAICRDRILRRLGQE